MIDWLLRFCGLVLGALLLACIVAVCLSNPLGIIALAVLFYVFTR